MTWEVMAGAQQMQRHKEKKPPVKTGGSFVEHRGTGFAGPQVLPPEGGGEATRSARSLEVY